jgi:predicted lipoprotein with Yx(FWY)xxD motif
MVGPKMELRRGRCGRSGRSQGAPSAARLAAGLLAATLLPATAVVAFAAPASASKALTITTVKISSIGTVLASSSGHTLYRYMADPPGKATCTGSCAQLWAPLLLPKGVTHVKGPKGVKGLSTIKVAHGRLQVAIHREALYEFAGDTKKGQAKGQAVLGAWFAVLKNGATSSAATPVTTAPGSTTTPTTAAKGATTTTRPMTTPTTTKTTTTSPPATTTPPTSPPTTTTPPPPPPPPTTTTTTTPGGGGVGF